MACKSSKTASTPAPNRAALCEGRDGSIDVLPASRRQNQLTCPQDVDRTFCCCKHPAKAREGESRAIVLINIPLKIINWLADVAATSVRALKSQCSRTA